MVERRLYGWFVSGPDRRWLLLVLSLEFWLAIARGIEEGGIERGCEGIGPPVVHQVCNQEFVPEAVRVIPAPQ
jgi:hypothetical protein